MRASLALDGKVCPRCPERGKQPRAAFSPNPARKDGLQTYCKPCTRQYHAEHRARNPEASRRWGRAFRERLRAEMFAAYGEDCACCGESEKAFLCLDHIEGLPIEHRDSRGERLSGDKILSRLRREGWPAGYRVLCANCNLAFAMFGHCPHERPLTAVA